MNKELNNIKSFFTPERIKLFRITEIERRAGIPRKALDHFICSRPGRSLTDEQIKSLIPVLTEIGYIPIG